jgi:hypothetical protein
MGLDLDERTEDGGFVDSGDEPVLSDAYGVS